MTMRAIDANRNTTTGVYYGVMNGNQVPYLLDDIMTNGTDITFQFIRTELCGRLGHILENWDTSDIREGIAHIIGDYHYRVDDLMNDLDLDQTAGDLLDDLECGGLWDDHESDCHEYEYDLGYAKVLLSWLGGSPLITVLNSDFVTNCRKCSPCVPNAGDLDSPDENGNQYYCLSADDMGEEWKGTVLSS